MVECLHNSPLFPFSIFVCNFSKFFRPQPTLYVGASNWWPPPAVRNWRFSAAKHHALFLFSFYVFMLIFRLYLIFEKENKIINDRKKTCSYRFLLIFLQRLHKEEDILTVKE